MVRVCGRVRSCLCRKWQALTPRPVLPDFEAVNPGEMVARFLLPVQTGPLILSLSGFLENPIAIPGLAHSVRIPGNTH